MDAKEYLEQARYLDMRITAKLAQLDELHRLMLQAGGSGSITAKIMTLQEETDRDVDELVALKKEIMAMIRRVSKPEYQTLLELRYLCFWTWERISMNMHYSQSQLFNLLPCALKEIDKILSEVAEVNEENLEKLQE